MKQLISLTPIIISTIIISVTLVMGSNQDVHDIRDYGAVCDGSTDDTIAIQLALDSGAGRSVYVPAARNRCVISRSLRVSSNTLLYGDGWSSRLQAAANFGDTEVIGNKTTKPSKDSQRDVGIRIQNLQIDGNQANNGPATEHSPCIFLRAVVDAHVEGVRSKNPKGDGIQMGAPSTATLVRPLRNTVVHNFIIGARRNGISVTEGEEINLDKNSIIDSSFHGVDLEANNLNSLIKDVTITRNLIISSGTSNFHNGVSIAGDKSLAQNVIISENIIESTFGGVIGFRSIHNLLIRNNLINNSSNIGIHRMNGGSFIPSTVSIDHNIVKNSHLQGIGISHTDNLVIKVNYVLSSGLYNIQIGNSSKALIQGNIIEYGALDGIFLTDVADATVVENNTSHNKANGIRLYGKMTGVINNTIAWNTSQSNGAWGVAESGVGADFNIITDNDVRYNASGGVQQLREHSVVSRNVGDD